MYLKAKCVGLLLAGVLLPALLAAQQDALESKATRSSDARQSSLMNASEGLSVIGAALETRKNGLARLDCSHLVHTVYERAGFPYSYASSSDLYAGVDEFQSITRPHAGDLVVWPGHVGIVVNPAESTFFSSLRTGIGVESYSSGYWKERGAPRFYRYAKVAGQERASAPSLTRATLDASPNTEPKLSVDVNPANSKFPEVQVIDSAKPKSKEVMQAILNALSADSNDLREVDVFKLNRPLIVFSQIEVRAVKIHGHQGQAQVRITALLSMEDGRVNPKQWQQVQTWAMRWRDRKSWELMLPQDAIYMPRETAVRILAHRLSVLADAENSSASLRQKTQLAQMLNAILAD
ncbi:MAG TPA: NlpC/P60 family protein [Terriglobales bacterium]|nr:NlpC/P60 family protein [Terriglobales bacterium]